MASTTEEQSMVVEEAEGGVHPSEGPDLGPAYRTSPERQRAQASYLRRRRLSVARPVVRFTVVRRRAAGGRR
jgi:hypothetical protein